MIFPLNMNSFNINFVHTIYLVEKSCFCHYVTLHDHQNPEIFLRECRDKAQHCFDFTSDMQLECQRQKF